MEIFIYLKKTIKNTTNLEIALRDGWRRFNHRAVSKLSTVAENSALPEMKGWKKNVAATKELLDKVSFREDGYINAFKATFWREQQRKVRIVRAMIAEPMTLLMDGHSRRPDASLLALKNSGIYREFKIFYLFVMIRDGVELADRIAVLVGNSA